MYANKSRPIQELKAIIGEVKALESEILRKVMENALERTRRVEANNGHHLKDIFKTMRTYFKTIIYILINANVK